jgi:hypothetical protein
MVFSGTPAIANREQNVFRQRRTVKLRLHVAEVDGLAWLQIVNAAL